MQLNLLILLNASDLKNSEFAKGRYMAGTPDSVKRRNSFKDIYQVFAAIQALGAFFVQTFLPEALEWCRIQQGMPGSGNTPLVRMWGQNYYASAVHRRNSPLHRIVWDGISDPRERHLFKRGNHL